MMSTPPIRTHTPLERALSLLLVTLLVSGMPLHAWAAPEGGQVTEGDATISQHGNTTLIRAADGTIINYTGFDIGLGETVQFLQPHVAARVLNRIMSADPTQIDGSLIANGHVYIVNPTGVFFGDTAMVNVNGLMAAAGNITDEAFMAGIDSFTNLTGPVENFGTIHANMVALLGNTVANHGAILAPDGLITMVAGDNVILTKMGEGIRVRVMTDGEPGSVDGTGVTNTGLLDAGENGSINLTAGDVYSVAVAHSGTAVARRMHAEGAGLVSSTGDITAGDVSLDGGSVFVDGLIDASGEEGGGNVMIGGQRTRVAIVGANATILANAITRGNGGNVIVAASDIAQIFGALQAKGGAESGDGGFIETSAAYLTVDADIDASAPNGDGGHWLIDPVDYEIVDAGAGVNQMTDEQVETALELGMDVTINTDGVGAEDGNITVESDADIDVDLTTNGGVRLTLQAHDSVTVDGTITATGDALDLTLSANDQTLPSPDGDAVGDVAVNDVIDTNGGSIEIFGEAIGLNAAITTQGGDFTVESNQAITATDLIDTSGNSPGGEVVMVAAAGNIVTADIDSSGTDGDAAGGVRIEAQAGNVTTGNITARGGDNTAGDAGAGGQVGLSALGAVDFASIDSSGGDASVVVAGMGGDAGDVAVTAGAGIGAVTAGDITAAGGSSENSAGGSGALVDIESTGGSVTVGTITTAGGDGTSGAASGGDAGDVLISALGSITTGDIDASGGDGVGGAGGAGSAIGMSSLAALSVGAINASGGSSDSGAGGAGGTIDLSANDGLLFTDMSTLGGGSTSDAGGDGGSVTLASANDTIEGDLIETDGGDGATGGSAGDVTADAGLDIEIDQIYADGGDGSTGAGGAGGNVQLTAADDIDGPEIEVYTHGGDGATTGGDAGDITLVADDLVELGVLEALGGDGGSGDGGAGGNIDIAASETDGTDLTLETTGGGSTDGAGGAGGDVTVALVDEGTIGASIDTSGGSTLGAGDGGDGGNVTISEDADLDLDPVDIVAQGGSSISGNGGDGGDITLDAGGSMSLTGASPALQTQGGNSETGNGGNGGAVRMTAASGDLTLTNAQILTGGGNSTDGAGGGFGGSGGLAALAALGGGNVNLGGGDAGGSSIVTNGGDAAGSGDAGSAGGIELESDTGNITVAAGTFLTANGGNADSGNGGNGGDVVVITGGAGAVTVTETIEAIGGTSNTGVAGLGGTTSIVTALGDVALGDVDLSGGNSLTGDGEDGGVFTRQATGVGGFTFGTIDVSGGDSLPGNGGDGGTVVLGTEMGSISGTAIDASGGDALDSGDGGAGGRIDLRTTVAGIISVPTLDASGGDSQTGNGGAGGEIALVTNAGDITVVSADASGGDVQGPGLLGGAGGQGGAITLRSTSTTVPGNITVGAGALDASGGDGASGDGGAGGEIRTETLGQVSVTGLSPAIIVNGGDSLFGNGGDGGNAFAAAGALGLDYTSASIEADGGSALGGVGNGGDGGTATLVAVAGGDITFNDADSFVSAQGGDAVGGTGGTGGNSSITAASGDVIFLGAGTPAVDVSGGQGNAGGDGGQSTVVTTTFDHGRDMRANGGRALGSGNGGDGGNIVEDVSGLLAHTGSVQAIGGVATGSGDGGNGGTVELRGGTVDLSTVFAGGGEASGSGAAGDGGSIDLIAFDTLTVLNANAGGSNSAGGTGGDGGSVSMVAPGLITASNVFAQGGIGPDGGGMGGDVTITGGAAGIVAPSILASGGNSTGTGDGGMGGTIALSTAGAGPITSTGGTGLLASGGDSADGAGGAGGEISVSSDTGVFTFDAPIAAAGGDSAGSDDGGAGGNVTMTTNADVTVFSDSGIDVSGGDSTLGAGGDGGDVGIDVGFGTLQTGGLVDATGGDGGAGTGGDGGNVTLAGGTLTHIIQGSVLAGGGDSDLSDGGAGGQIGLDGGAINLTGLLFEAEGGDALGGAGNGGAGGSVAMNGSTISFGGSGRLRASGGDALGSGAGGAGGDVTLTANDYTGEVELEADGGSAAGDGNGGAGGAIAVNGGLMVLTLTDVSADGGASGNGAGGAGGSVVFTGADLTLSGPISAEGGDGNGDGDGGNGGSVAISAIDAIVLDGDTTISTNGGDSTAGNGGDGGDVSIASVDGDVNADILNINTFGGSSSGDGDGGDAGDITVSSTNASVVLGDVQVVAATWNASGGSSAGSGDGGDGGEVSLSAANDLAATGESVLVVVTNGGSSQQGDAGDGGDVTLDANGIDFDRASFLMAGGNSTEGDAGDGGNFVAGAQQDLSLGIVVTQGGATAGQGDAGDGGTVDVSAQTGGIDVASVSSAGGNATGSGNGGDAGAILLTTDFNPGAGGNRGITVAGNLLADGGDAANDGLGGDGANVTVSAGRGGAQSDVSFLGGRIDTSGGDSAENDGGNAANVVVNTQDGAVVWTPDANGIAIDASGGNSTDGSTAGNGGLAGNVDIVTGKSSDAAFDQSITIGTPSDDATITTMGGSSGPIPAGPLGPATLPGQGDGQGRDGGNVLIVASEQTTQPGDITHRGDINTSGGTGTNAAGGADGGMVQIRAEQGGVTLISTSPGIVTSGSSSLVTSGGNAGNVDIIANGDILHDSYEIYAVGGSALQFPALADNVGNGGTGGQVHLESMNGSVSLDNASNVFTYGGNAAHGNGGDGGNVEVLGEVDAAGIGISVNNDTRIVTGFHEGLGLGGVVTEPTGGNGGNAGDITLDADGIVEMTGDGSGLIARGAPTPSEVGGNGGNGGEVFVASRLSNVEGNGGAVIDTRGGDVDGPGNTGNAGQGGNVLVQTGDDNFFGGNAIDWDGDVTTNGGDVLGPNASGDGGDAGTIRMIATNEVDLGAGNSLSAVGGDTVFFLNGQTGDAGDGGAVTVRSLTSNVEMQDGAIVADGGDSDRGNAGDGGNISLLADQGAIFSLDDTGLGVLAEGLISEGGDVFGDGSTGNAGSGGDVLAMAENDVRLDSQVFVRGGNIQGDTTTGNAGNGGNVTYESEGGSVEVLDDPANGVGPTFQMQGGLINSDDSTGNAGDGGDLRFTAGDGDVLLQANVFAGGGSVTGNNAAGNAGDGGSITMVATDGEIVVDDPVGAVTNLDTTGGSVFGPNPGDGGDGGPISATADDNVEFWNVISRTTGGNAGGTGDGGNGGDYQAISTDEDVLLLTGQINTGGGSTDTGEAGDGGNVLIDADGTVNSGGTPIITSGGGVAGDGGSGGDAGDVRIVADENNVLLQVGSNITARGGATASTTGTGGDGGMIDIDSLQGNVQSDAVMDTTGGDVTAAAAAGDAGAGGDVAIDAESFVILNANNDITTDGGDQTGAGSTGHAGDAGDIGIASRDGFVRVLATDFSAEGGEGQIGDGGDGGDVTVTANEEVDFDANIDTTGGSSSDATGAGNGGDGGMVMMAAGDGDLDLSGALPLVAATRSIDTSGGDAAGTGQAGNGGDVMLSSEEQAVRIGSTSGNNNNRYDITTNGGDDNEGAGGTAGDISAIASTDIDLNGDLTALPGNDGAGTGFVALVSQDGGNIGVDFDPDPLTPRIHAGDFVLIDAGDPVAGIVFLGGDIVAKDHVDQPAADKLAGKGVDVTGLVEGEKGIKIRNADEVQIFATPDRNLIAENGAISVDPATVGNIVLGGTGDVTFDGNGDFYTELAPINDEGASLDSLNINDEGDIFIAEDPATGHSIELGEGDININVDDDGDGAQILNVAGFVLAEEGDIRVTGTDVNDDMAFGDDVTAINMGDSRIDFEDFGAVRFAKEAGTTQTVTADNITFNAPDASPLGQRPNVPRIATVARSFPGDLDIIATEDVRFGHNEKVSVPGDLQVRAGDDVAIGDVAALNINVAAGDQITINTRVEEQVEVRDGGFESDEGVDIVGNTITYTAPGGIVKSGQGNNQVLIGTPTAFTEGGEMNDELLAFVEDGRFQIAQIHPDGRLLTEADFFRNGVPGDIPANDIQGSRQIANSVVLDIVPIGPSRGNVGENFAGTVAATNARPDIGTNQAAVSSAPLRENTLLAFLECGSDDEVGASDKAECEEQNVGDARARSEAAKATSAAYLALFGTYDVREARVAQRQQELEMALQEGDVDAPVLATIRRLFDGADEMGMSDQSMANFQIAVLTAVRPENRSMEEVWELLAASY